ncbi:Putative methyltransferase DDB_G0268948 [Linum grandiflorum]
MSKLFIKQAKEYAKTRPSYPQQLFHFIASTTPSHHLVWDVGTGSGQAAQSLAGIYKNVIATDTSETQLKFAPKLPNVQYRHTPPVLTISDLPHFVADESTVDLVTVAQALHWLDLPEFYRQVKWLLKKPDGVIAAWCYGTPEVNSEVDSVFNPFYAVDSAPYWDPQRKLVDDGYNGVDFPFDEAVEGGTGPFRFVTEKLMDLDAFLMYLRSWSAYQTAKEKGVELLRDDLIHKFRLAWDQDGVHHKLVRFPVYLRIGKVGCFAKN